MTAAQCELLEYRDGQGVCRVVMESVGFELPQVGFDDELLKYHGLQPGDTFLWYTGDRNTTCEDIVPDPLPFAEEIE